MAASSSMRSVRFPFGRFLYVGGNRDTRLSQVVPGVRVEITNRFAVEAVSAPVFSVAVYFFHFVSSRPVSARAQTVLPSFVSIDAVNGPWSLLAAFAQNDNR